MKKQVIKLGIAAFVGTSMSGCSSSSRTPISVKGIVVKHPDGVVIDTTQLNSENHTGLLIEGLDTMGISPGDSMHLRLDTATRVALEYDIIKN